MRLSTDQALKLLCLAHPRLCTLTCRRNSVKDMRALPARRGFDCPMGRGYLHGIVIQKVASLEPSNRHFSDTKVFITCLHIKEKGVYWQNC